MLENEIIQPSESPWNFQILIVPKKMDASGIRKWRMCVDFRKLNDITVGDSFPLPNIQDILDKLGRAQYFFCNRLCKRVLAGDFGRGTQG
jgi:hypothetical protein